MTKDTPVLMTHFIRPSGRRRDAPSLSPLRSGWLFRFALFLLGKNNASEGSIEK